MTQQFSLRCATIVPHYQQRSLQRVDLVAPDCACMRFNGPVVNLRIAVSIVWSMARHIRECDQLGATIRPKHVLPVPLEMQSCLLLADAQ